MAFASLLIALLALSAPTPVPAPAVLPDGGRNWPDCRNDSGSTPADRIVAACTALLGSAGLGNHERSVALSGRAIGYRMQSDFQRAISDYQEALRISPGAAWPHSGLGASYRAQQDYRRSAAEYGIFIGMARREVAAASRRPGQEPLIRRLAIGYYARGQTFAGQGDHRRALADYRKALRRLPRDADIGNAVCWTLAAHLRSHFDEARAACDAALRARPDDPALLDSRGMVGLRQRRFQAAWNDYDAAVRLQPDGPSWVYGRGIAALRLGRTAQGRADIARAQALHGEVAQFYADFGLRP